MTKKKEPWDDSARPNGRDDTPSAAPESQPTGAVPASAEAAGGRADPLERILALEAQVADLNDRLLRKQADFENFRKRVLREREEATRYANAALLGDLLAVIDDFERAIRSAEEARDFPTFLEGVGMIERRMLEMLESSWGLKRFSAVGEAFDPVRHEAMMRTEVPAGGLPAGPVVVEEYQKGFFLHDRVLRPARVRVQVPAELGATDAATGPDRGG